MLTYRPMDRTKLILLNLTYMGDGRDRRMCELIIISAGIELQTDHSYRATYPLI